MYMYAGRVFIITANRKYMHTHTHIPHAAQLLLLAASAKRPREQVSQTDAPATSPVDDPTEQETHDDAPSTVLMKPAEHAVHSAAPMPEKRPTEQPKHSVEFNAALARPLAQEAHGAPSQPVTAVAAVAVDAVSVRVPAGHTATDVAMHSVAPTPDLVLDGHAEHTAAPVDAWNVFTAHKAHSDDASTCANVPAAQDEHDDEPCALANIPETHDVHCVELLAAEKRPEAQKRHDEAAVAS